MPITYVGMVVLLVAGFAMDEDARDDGHFLEYLFLWSLLWLLFACLIIPTCWVVTSLLGVGVRRLLRRRDGVDRPGRTGVDDRRSREQPGQAPTMLREHDSE